jgi:hypothetical protein
VQTTEGDIATLNDLPHPSAVNEPLGLITHGWDRTGDSGEIIGREFITDTGLFIRNGTIIEDQNVSTSVNLPQQIVTPADVVQCAEATAGRGLFGRGKLSDRRRQYLVDNAELTASQVNRFARQIIAEYWVIWFSAEGLPVGVDGVYELDFANEAEPSLRSEILNDFRSRLVDQTRLSSDQAEALLPAIPETIEIEVHVYADGHRIL